MRTFSYQVVDGIAMLPHAGSPLENGPGVARAVVYGCVRFVASRLAWDLDESRGSE